MKILSILVDLKINKLTKSFIDYLIDAGHFVFVNRDQIEEQWAAQYTHNFTLVTQEQLKQLQIDYVLHLVDEHYALSNQSLVLNFHRRQNQMELFSFVGKEQKQKRVIYKQLISPPADHDPAFLSYMRTELTELFIDTIIHLSKYGESDLVSEASASLGRQFREFHAYEQGIAELNQYYQEVTRDEGLFLLPSRKQGLPSSEAKMQQSCHFPVTQKNYLELFTLYLLQLFNGRKDGIYAYDLHESGTRVSKYISCYAQDDYFSLLQRYQDARYEVSKNKFYTPDQFRHSQVLVTLDVFNEAEDAAVVIHYDAGLETLTLTCQPDLYFFAALSEIARQFFAGLEDFVNGYTQLGDFHRVAAVSWCITQNTQRQFPQTTMQQLVEKQVALHPNQVAVACGEYSLTYRELNEQANQLAGWIQSVGIAEEQLIVLYLNRTVDLVIAVLAVLKSGNAYVPLDLKYPNERIATIINDCQPALILTHSCYVEQLANIAANTPLFVLDKQESKAQLALFAKENIVPASKPGGLAYVIYTSGTTGKPKGVMIEHKALVNTITYFAEVVAFTAADKLLAVTTIAFDIAGLELYMPLICGGEIIIAAQQEVMDAPRLIQLITEKQITVMQATPSLWHLVKQALAEKTLPIKALCGGEALNEPLALELLAKVKCLWNVYGPTETTIWSTIHLCQSSENPSFIGQPIANTECYVLDEQLAPLPAGAIGELYLGGSSLARGYWGAPELTAEKFVKNPFTQQGSSERLYKTGDLVRWAQGGKLEFIGRNDFQVKIRGHRIELGDIESAINELAAVKQSVVVVHSMHEGVHAAQGTHYLLGYYVADSVLDEETMMVHLAQKLPDYMLPSILIALENIPLNSNGKVDRKALPLPDLNNSLFMAPRNELEIRLCALWGEVLGLAADRANILDDFFRLGGNSILAIQLVNKINHELHSDIAIRDVFIEKTIANLAVRVEMSLGQFIYKEYQIHAVNQANLYKPFPLNNVQQTYYWGRFNHFELSNISTHVYTEFKYTELDVARLQSTFNQLIQRHLALRTVFAEDQQCFLEEVGPYQIAYWELTQEAELLEKRQQFSHKVYSPDTYPLFDIFVTKFNGVFLLHVSFDAIIIDMSSFNILFTEWIQLYNNSVQQLPVLNLNFRDYMLQSEQLRKSPLFEQAQSYWQNRLDDYYLECNLPLLVRPAEVEYPHFKRISKTIARPIWERLAAKAHKSGISLTVVVLEVYARTLCFWSGQNQLTINLTLFNRLPLHQQVNDLIGDFTALELFAYQHTHLGTINSVLGASHQRLLTDIEHNLFDGIDFQRLLRQHQAIPMDTILSPIVLTSVLGGSNQGNLFNLPLDDSYQGVHYAISQTSQVWLDNKAYETSEGFVAEWDYVEQLFAPEIIQAMHHNYCQLIEALAVADWEQDAFPVLFLPEEHIQLINQANNAQQPCSEETLVSAYERRLQELGQSERIAVVDSGKQARYSHGQLWSDSEQLSGRLLALGKQSPLIAVLSEKGYNQVVATLSIMKAGYAYLPLHVDWPQGRLHEVLQQGGVELVLLSEKMASNEELYAFLATHYAVCLIEEVLAEPAIASPAKPLVHADDVAYVIFTSGSTGKPKGVTISHRGALNTLEAVNKRFAVTAEDRVLALSELSFDLSVYDVFGLLLAGGGIIFPAQEQTKEPEHWLSLIQEYQISLWNTVPQLAGLLLDEGREVLPCLRVFLLSGDWIPVSLAKKIRQKCPKAQLMSLGGATEGSIWSIWYPIEEVDAHWKSIPYGVAMPNQQMYVLNQEGAHCPVGVVGEIHIGGLGVALNYWGDEAITQRQFFTHPHLGRLYRTGDLGRWHKAGYMEFCGRNDFQVKMNGYRVELDEITAKIEQLQGVEKAVVTLQNNEGREHLVAYLLPEHREQESTLDKDLFKLEQRGLLKNSRISYQLPQAIHCMQANVRKSYRHFSADSIDIDLVKEIGTASINLPVAQNKQSTKINSQSLMRILAVIAGQQIPNKALPKYQYPSGGSCYAVRCFVHVKEQAIFPEITAGCFYYHPLKQALCESNLLLTAQHLELQFVVHWPAIKPLYADLSKRLAYIEAGHMLHLILAAMQIEGIPYALSVEDQALDSENHLLARVKIGQEHLSLPQADIVLNYLSKKNECYIDVLQKPVLDPSGFSIFTQGSDFGQLLSSGQLIITAEGESSWQNFLMAGYFFQAISQALYMHHIGSCMLGFTPHAKALYAMVLGCIDEKEKQKSESLAQVVPLQQIINQQLSKTLPDYMLPHAYALLDALPLSANGKLAKNQLPVITIKCEYQEPANELERQIATIWASILSLPPESIGRTDNFFALGGNSLLAMQLVRQLNRELQLNIKLTEVYQYGTLSEIARNYSPVEEAREEGVI